MSPARKQIEELTTQKETTQVLFLIRKAIAEEAVSMNSAFDYEGLDEEVAKALSDLSHDGDVTADI